MQTERGSVTHEQMSPLWKTEHPAGDPVRDYRCDPPGHSAGAGALPQLPCAILPIRGAGIQDERAQNGLNAVCVIN